MRPGLLQGSPAFFWLCNLYEKFYLCFCGKIHIFCEPGTHQVLVLQVERVDNLNRTIQLLVNMGPHNQMDSDSVLPLYRISLESEMDFSYRDFLAELQYVT